MLLCNLDDFNQILWPYLMQYKYDLLHIEVFCIILFATSIEMDLRIVGKLKKSYLRNSIRKYSSRAIYLGKGESAKRSMEQHTQMEQNKGLKSNIIPC